MHVLVAQHADAGTPRRLPTGVLGRQIDTAVGDPADGGGAQLQHTLLGQRHQSDGAVVASLEAQATALQQPLQAVDHRIVALERLRHTTATGQAGLIEQTHVGLLGEVDERRVESLGGHVELYGLRLCGSHGQGEYG